MKESLANNQTGKKVILFLSHKEKRCGVYQFGFNVSQAIKKSKKYTFVYAEALHPDEYDSIVTDTNPSAIIYNYYQSTMPWLEKKVIRKYKIPHVGFIHEVTQAVADSANDSLFQFHIAADPTLLLKNPIVYKTGRLVPKFTNNLLMPKIPTIGSFGFGFEGKGFERVIMAVQNEFDEALIRLHIPIAAFGDADGSKTKIISEGCQNLLRKPGISLVLSNDFLSQELLLESLAQNSLNAFFYDRFENRGISGVIDLAIAAQRPIAVTKSHMFRHLISTNPSICVEDASLKEIMRRGIKPLEPYYNEWTEENLVWDYERILDNILNKTMSSKNYKTFVSVPNPYKSRRFNFLEKIKPVYHLMSTFTIKVLHKLALLKRHLNLSGDKPFKKELSLYETPIGNYYLPSDLTTDMLINEIKAGRIFEPKIVATAKKYIMEGSTVLDVGSNFGQMTLLFSKYAGGKGHVFSFEADEFIFCALEKNIAANKHYNITAICKAVYDRDGDILFYPELDFKRFGSYRSYGLNPHAKEGRKIGTITIDSLNIESPISFMKVDVQDGDLFVLQGAVETIRRHQMPILFKYEEQFQNEFGISFEDYRKFINVISYRVEEIIDEINFLIVPKKQDDFVLNLPSQTPFNRILDNVAREQYNPAIRELFSLVPEMMGRKIPEANIQQAFVLDTVRRFSKEFPSPKMLCVGSYEDSASAALKRSGFQIQEIDPVLNYDLDTFVNKPSTILKSYDIIFSTSVLEHVENDERFITQTEDLLSPGGVAILTCDYNDQFKPGDSLPKEDFRFYTQQDFKNRLLPLLKRSELVDNPQWDCSDPDFEYGACKYTFATLVFRKKDTRDRENSNIRK